MSQHTKILLVDDHSVLREGLRALLQTEAGFIVVGEAGDGRQAVEMVKQLAPDVVVMDVRMPGLNGFEAARQAIAAKPGLRVIGLSAQDDNRSGAEMLRAGAVGYVAKEAAFSELVVAIRTVMNNKVYFDPAIIAGAANSSALSVLSAREREVLQLIAEGNATKEIAIQLHVSVKTAETHRRNLMEKLNLDSVAKLTKYAIRENMTSI